MTYDPKSEYKDVWLRALKGTFTFRGRSTRTEFLVYYISTILVILAITLVLMIGPLVGRTAILNSDTLPVVDWLISIPLLALFFRRLQDHGRPGWLAFLFLAFSLAVVIYNIQSGLPWYRSYNVNGYWTAPFIILALALVAGVFWPGTEGPNRYGPDPRKDAD